MSEKKKLCVLKEPNQVETKATQVSTNNFSIDNLSEKHISKILQYLTIKERIKFEAVCKKWQKASKLSWRDTVKLDFSILSFLKNHLNFPTLELDPSVVKKVLSRCGEHLTDLNAGLYCDFCILSIINDYCPNLMTFSIGFKSFSKVEFPGSLRKMEKLKSIVYSSGRDMLDSDYDKLLQMLPTEIEKIGFFKDYDESKWIPNISDLKFIKNFKALQSLEMGSYRITDVPHLPTLKNLSLISCWIERDLLIGKCNDFEYLDLQETYPLDGRLILYLTDNCKNLKYLDISGQETGERFDTESLQTLGKLKKLEQLFLNDIYYAVDDTVIDHLNYNLRILECKSCEYITDASILKVLINCENLERLVVAGTGVTVMTLELANDITKCGKKLELHIDLDILQNQQVYSRKNNTFLDVFACVGRYETKLWDSEDEMSSDDDEDD